MTLNPLEQSSALCINQFKRKKKSDVSSSSWECKQLYKILRFKLPLLFLSSWTTWIYQLIVLRGVRKIEKPDKLNQTNPNSAKPNWAIFQALRFGSVKKSDNRNGSVRFSIFWCIKPNRQIYFLYFYCFGVYN